MAGAATAYGEGYPTPAHAASDIDGDEATEVARRLEAIAGDIRSGVLILPRDAGAGRDSEALVAVLGAILRAGR